MNAPQFTIYIIDILVLPPLGCPPTPNTPLGLGRILCKQSVASAERLPTGRKNTQHPARPKDACYQRDARTPIT